MLVLRVLVPLTELVIVPPDPLKAGMFATMLCRSSVPPLTVTPPVPSAWALPICNVPLLTVVPPVWLLLPLRTMVPAPSCIMPPDPATVAAKSVPWVRVLERLNASVALLTMALLAESEPVAPPSPSCSVPALIDVAPVYQFEPLRIVVPEPAWTTLPDPEIVAPKSLPCVNVFERLNRSVPLSVIALLPESEPVLPPSPSCNVPAEIIVVPT